MKLGEGSELVQAYTVTKKASNPPLSAPKVLTSQKPFPEVGMDLENSPTPLCHFPLSARTHLCQGGYTLGPWFFGPSCHLHALGILCSQRAEPLSVYFTQLFLYTK